MGPERSARRPSCADHCPYRLAMTAQGPDELHAIHAARRELGPDYDDALLESFVDRAGAQLRQRLDNDRLQSDRAVGQRDVPRNLTPVQVTIGPAGLTLALVNAGWGVLSSFILTEAYHDQLARLVVIWMVVVVADGAYLGARIAGRAHERQVRDDMGQPRTPRADPPVRRTVPGQRSGRTTSP
jgi:hypothetical protein